ncbi:MAG TPA: alpha/beta hydrolase [Acidimicrobiales bacterium]|nr:alpha/beta hydrolase [Acidimicrobiales bacterium]
MPPIRATTPDGVDLALHDLGGVGPSALLVHATGFHGRVFGPLARSLGDRLHCIAPDLRGQGESGVPGNLDFDWVGFGTDVLTAVDALGLERPVGVGHSCGGAALLLAEEARPGTFSALYCFEPVVIGSDEPPSPDPSIHLARAARQRREVFPSRREAYDNYASKPPLDVLDREALCTYVEFGFEDLPDGTVRLRCRGANEARIYEMSVRHPAFSKLGAVSCPVTLACGGETDSFGPAALEPLAERLPNGHLEVIPELGHFGPLEQPAAVAASVIRAFDPPRA